MLAWDICLWTVLRLANRLVPTGQVIQITGHLKGHSRVRTAEKQKAPERNQRLFRDSWPEMHAYCLKSNMGFPSGSDGKESTHHGGDLGLIPGSGRSPGGGNGNPLQCSRLEKSTDRGAWRATVRGLQRVGRDWVTNTWRAVWSSGKSIVTGVMHTCVHDLAWPPSYCLTSLNFPFLFCKMGVIFQFYRMVILTEAVTIKKLINRNLN